jgi:predicted esterase
MKTTLLALHGYTMRGDSLRRAMSSIAPELDAYVDVLYPDAPHACDADEIERMYREWDAPVPDGPHLTWWYASEDGSHYRGWEESCDAIAELARGRDRLALLGFSQGAMMATVIAALSARGEFPPIDYAVVIAGRIPRAHALEGYLARPIAVPSLHVWGTSDRVSGAHAPRLLERFDGGTRTSSIWPGPHVVPSQGPAKDAIVEFVARRSNGAASYAERRVE